MSDYSSTYPTQSPVFAFDAKAGKLDSRINYTRSSGGTYLSNEKSLNSENLLLQSENLGTTWAVFTDLTSPTGNQTAPDGTSNAWLLTATTGANKSPSLSQNLVSGAGTHTLVAHLKAGSASHGFVSVRVSNGNVAYAMIDFSAGTSTHGSYGSVTNPSSTVTALGSNWYRLTLTATVSSGLAIAFIGISNGSAVQSSGYATDWSSSGETLYAWGVQLSSTNSKVYDSPTTTQISREFAPTLKTSQSDQPRFEYSATDGQSVGSGTAKGLLIEAQSSNLLTYSEDFSNAAWNAFRSSKSASVAVGPDGNLSAGLLTEDETASASHGMYAEYNATSGNAYTYSVFAKAAGRNYLQIVFNNYGGRFGNESFTFNLTNGTLGETNSGLTSYSITACGNGWYRCSATVSAVGTGTARAAFYTAASDSASIDEYTGNGYSGLLLFGASVEQASSVSSYIKSNSGSSTTRAADSCSVALSDVGITSGQDLTAIVEGDAAEIAGAALIGFDDGSSSNYARILRHHSNNNYTFDVRTNASSQAVITLNSSSTANEFAFRLEQNNIGASAGGSAVTTDTSATLGLMTTMQIGNAYWGTQANGAIGRVSIYSEPLSDTNLTALTS